MTHPAKQGATRAARKPMFVVQRDAVLNPGEPTQAQAQRGAYAKPAITFRGLRIRIENPAGSVRRGRNRDGQEWHQRMHYAYGEIVGSQGVDGDPVDVFIGPNEQAEKVYVVHQRKVNRWDEYDEDKCMLGFDSEEEARAAFLACYSDPRFLGPITVLTIDEFKRKVRATKETPAMIKALFFKALVSPSRGHES